MEKTIIPSYKNEVKELRTTLKKMLPADALKVFDDDADELNETHKSILKLNTGDKAIDFKLLNAVNKTVSLYDLLKQGRVVLTFYRGTWCPYCNLALRQYQQVLPKIHEANAQLVAVSSQTPDESLNFKEKNELEFHVLSDNHNMVAKEYTTVFRNSDSTIEEAGKLGIDYDAHYSENTRELPIPAVFIIEQNGTISFAKTEGGDYRKRISAKEIIDFLDKTL